MISQEELHQCKADLEHIKEKFTESNERYNKMATEFTSTKDNLAKLRQTR